MLKTSLAGMAALCALLVPASLALAASPDVLAIIGDTPYGQPQIDRFPGDVAQINADPDVSRVIHLGDIKNGSSRCDTSYFRLIRSDFDGFADPLVYTPGDNEWTDCHRANNGGYQPAGATPPGAESARLETQRSTFFDRPGPTRGRPARVDGQSAAFVENVSWSQAGVTWGTLNVPGSNNDLAPWFGDAETDAQKAAQEHESESRLAADLAWIDRVFARANREDAAAVAISLQADMWDPRRSQPTPCRATRRSSSGSPSASMRST